MAPITLDDEFVRALADFGRDLAGHDRYYVVSHHDADGITSCAITVDLLRSLGKAVEYRCMKQIDSVTVNSIRQHEGITQNQLQGTF